MQLIRNCMSEMRAKLAIVIWLVISCGAKSCNCYLIGYFCRAKTCNCLWLDNFVWRWFQCVWFSNAEFCFQDYSHVMSAAWCNSFLWLLCLYSISLTWLQSVPEICTEDVYFKRFLERYAWLSDVFQYGSWFLCWVLELWNWNRHWLAFRF